MTNNAYYEKLKQRWSLVYDLIMYSDWLFKICDISQKLHGV